MQLEQIRERQVGRVRRGIHEDRARMEPLQPVVFSHYVRGI